MFKKSWVNKPAQRDQGIRQYIKKDVTESEERNSMM